MSKKQIQVVIEYPDDRNDIILYTFNQDLLPVTLTIEIDTDGTPRITGGSHAWSSWSIGSDIAWGIDWGKSNE